MIEATDLPGVDESLARRIIATARSIAPGLDDLTGEPYEDAIAILLGVATDAGPRGSRMIKSQRTATSGVEYFDVASWFSADDRAALRALVSAIATGGLPQGSFPRPSRALSHIMPHEIYDS